MEITEKDIQKINSIVRVLGNAMKDIEEIAAKVEAQKNKITHTSKRKNLKLERIENYQYRIISGQMRRPKNK